MSFHVSPVPLFAIFGKRDDRIGWIRKRVLFIDDDGGAWLCGREPWTHPTTKEHKAGDKRLVPALSYADFLGIEPGDDPNSFVPAPPGWRVVEAWCIPGDEPEWEGKVADVAAWQVRAGTLFPVTFDEMGIAPCMANDSENASLVRILGPSDPAPSMEDIVKWAKADHKLKRYFEEHSNRTGKKVTP